MSYRSNIRIDLFATLLAGALSGGILSSVLTHWWWEPQRNAIINKREALEKLISPVAINLRRTKAAYDRYHRSGKTFGHARWLYQGNLMIRETLLKNSHLLPLELLDSAECLVVHYDSWINRYENKLTEFGTTPKPAEKFSIALANLDLGRCSEFDDESAAKFHSFYHKLRKELEIQ